MRKVSIIAAFAFVLLAATISFAAVTGAAIVNSAGTNTSLYFDTGSTSYADNVAGVNPDCTIRIWGTAAGDVQNKYVGAVYGMGDDTDYFIFTTAGGTYPLAQTGAAVSCGASCYYSEYTPTVSFLVAALPVGSGSGNPGAAYFPAYPYIVVSSDNTVDAGDTFVYVTNTILRGSYTTNNVQSTYNQATGSVSITVSGITGTKTSGSESITKTNPWLVVGICTDSSTCYASSSIARGSTATLSTGVINPSNTAPAVWRNYSVNGIRTAFCMGPNLLFSSPVSVTPSSGVFDGDNVTVSATVNNNNNVDVNVSFDLDFYLDSIAPANLINSTTISSLAKGSSSSYSFDWSTFNQTGSHTIYAVIDQSDTIKECIESDNVSSRTLTVDPVYRLTFWIDGVQNDTFGQAGRPYNVTVLAQSTSGGGTAVDNATVMIYEKNGLAVFSPIQAWNEGATKRAVISYSVASIQTNSSGLSDFTLIPTGNRLIELQPTIADYTGNYSLYAELWVSGAQQQLSYGGVRGTQMSLYLSNMTAGDPTGTAITVNHQADFTEQVVLDYVSRIYVTVKGWLHP